MKCSMVIWCCCIMPIFGHSQLSLTLPNGWRLTPTGKQISLGDLPLNMALSPDKKLLAITNNGQSTQSIQLVDLHAERVVDSLVVPKSWYGLHFSADGRMLFASGGNDNCIRRYRINGKKLAALDSLPLGTKWPTRISPAGIDLHPDGGRLFVVTKENNSLYEVDLSGTGALRQFPLGHKAYTCLLSPDGSRLYISLWGADSLLVWDTQSRSVLKTMPIGDNPNELLLTRDGLWLYVANANDNSVAVVNTRTMAVAEVLHAALYSGAPNGSTTNGLAMNEAETRLYVANADNNCLAVFDVTKKGDSRGLGFIPTGWYPTSVKVVGKKVFVANGKGLTSLPNPEGPNPALRRETVTYQQSDNVKPKQVQYIGGLFTGTLSIFPEPDARQLKAFTTQVYTNTPYQKEKELLADGEAGNPIPRRVGDDSPIKHVFYIIKENRTYDQVLGDLPQGNGDTSLVLFGRRYTPNQHALAEQFVLLDNFYVDAEVSADGHNWSTAAYANDYTEKTWPTSYGGRGGTYDYEGQKAIAYPKGGFIWDHCQRAGVTYRTYGEFADNFKANIPALEGRFCTYFTGWDESVKDTTRFYQWRRDFDSLVAMGRLPQLNTLRFINDHTEGLRLGRPTPFAHVADNDYAVGLFLEHLSNSSVWAQSVVFIIEDDAQNGPDHVDAHRSTAYVAGPHVRRGFVDHTMYSTSGMLRTMELILGLAPMSQYDAAATPMWRCFTSYANTTPFTAIKPSIDLNEVNKKPGELATISESFDFSKEDMAPDLLFSEVVWKAVKGESSIMPAPVRAAFLWIDEDESEEKLKPKANKKRK